MVTVVRDKSGAVVAYIAGRVSPEEGNAIAALGFTVHVYEMFADAADYFRSLGAD